MTFDLVRIFREMSGFQTGIVLVLAAMGIASLSVFIERLWALGRMRGRSRKFVAAAAGPIERRDYDALRRDADVGKSPVAVLIGGALKGYQAENPGGLNPVEAARREVGRRTEMLAAQARRGMGVLATVGSIAPFVGLLGTVVGIIAAFEGIATEGSAGLGAIATGIAEALVVTALGLVIAIPAVLMFNLLSGKADALMLSLGHAGSEFIDHLEAGHVPGHGATAQANTIGRSAAGGY
jgi:biopolymer transport protein ExbB